MSRTGTPTVRCLLLAVSAALLLGGCAGTSPPGNTVADLTVSFGEDTWNGVAVPPSGRCRRCGGEGLSPALRIGNLPAGTTAVVVEFNDLSYAPMAAHGGHGAVRLAVPAGSTVAVLPSFRENSVILPPGVTAVHGHRAVGYGDGVYLAPCSCGSNNYYSATVRAVGTRDGREHELAAARISLGQF